MNAHQVAAQLYTVREFCRTAPDLAATARKVRSIGYGAVQVSGVGPIPPEEIARIMAGEGLVICATHEPSDIVLDEPEKVVERLKTLGCARTAYPYPQGIDFGDAHSIEALAGKLDASGAKLRSAGIVLGYHNHDLEFRPFRGATVLDYIYAHTDPRNLVAELDTFWVHCGGGDCLEWCRRLRGRMPFIHIKDCSLTADQKPAFAEIGRGTLPFREIIAEAERSGCEWFIVEQDTCPGDPFDSLRLSLEYIRANLLS